IPQEARGGRSRRDGAGQGPMVGTSATRRSGRGSFPPRVSGPESGATGGEVQGLSEVPGTFPEQGRGKTWRSGRVSTLDPTPGACGGPQSMTKATAGRSAT